MASVEHKQKGFLKLQNKRNSIDSLYLLSKTTNGKFEFLFTPLSESKKDCASVLTEIHKLVIT